MALWLLTFFLFALLFTLLFLVPGKMVAGERKRILQDFTESMDQFSYELQEDNRKLVEKFSEMKQEMELKISGLGAKVELLEKRCTELSQQLAMISLNRFPHTAEEHRPAIEPSDGQTTGSAATERETEDVQVPPASFKERYKALFELYDNGKSVDYIAKKLEMNKGEVLTILQLAKHEKKAQGEK